MLSGLVFLPAWFSIIAMIILLVAGFAEYRQGYIGRVAIFGNAMLLWQVFFASWDKLPDFFQWYLNIGTAVAVIAIVSYVTRQSLPSEFYTICYVAYGSISVLLAIFFAFQFGLFS
jgi:hypothetical protein